MFTGIITDLGALIAAKRYAGGDGRFVIRTGFDMDGVVMGASIACDGCCLTVVEKSADSFTVDVSNETLSCTTLGDWKTGHRINLERSLKAGDEMGGHIVSGHVDGLAILESIEPDGESKRLIFSVPDALANFIAPKGSVSLNGVSLTVNEVKGARFGINIIPHTWRVTNIGKLHPGDRLNMEVDMMARYVARILGREAA